MLAREALCSGHALALLAVLPQCRLPTPALPVSQVSPVMTFGACSVCVVLLCFVPCSACDCFCFRVCVSVSDCSSPSCRPAGGVLYTATVKNFLGTEPIISRAVGRAEDWIRTETLSSWLNGGQRDRVTWDTGQVEAQWPQAV